MRPRKLPPLSVAATIALLVAAAVVAVYASMGRSFLQLAPGYAQHLYGVSSLRSNQFSLGGVVVLQDGTVISAECRGPSTRLHVFDPGPPSPSSKDPGTLVHPENSSFNIQIVGGCGIAFENVGGQNYIFSNLNDASSSDGDGTFGIARIQWPSLSVTKMAPGFPGNGLGIAVDPLSGDLVYVGAACRLTNPLPAACPLYRFNPATGVVTTFASLSGSQFAFVDGIAFEPIAAPSYSGSHLFITNRTTIHGELDVIDRLGQVVSRTPLVDTATTGSDPVGIGFHISPAFVVTNNQDATMTRYDYPGNNYEAPAAPTLFASGGSRGDMIQAGPDGCLYVTQLQTVYNDPTKTDSLNSIVQICPGFAPPPGIIPSPPPSPASLCGFVYHDANDNGVRESAEAPIGGVAINLSGSDYLDLPVSASTTTSSTDGSYCFNNLQAGTYTISEVQPLAYLDGKDTQGTPGTGTTGNDAFTNIRLDAGVNGANNNFGELLPASLGGFVYLDANNNGTKQPPEAGISGAAISLTGTDDLGAAVTMSGATGVDGAYAFTNLRPGTYTLTEQQPAGYADGQDMQGTPGTGTTGNDTFTNIVLGSGVNGQNNNFGELPADTLPPTCTIDVKKGPPLKVTMTFRDSGSGIARFEIVQAVNLTTTLPSFSAPSPGPLVVTGTRIIQRKSDGMTIRAIDAAGNEMLCDPVTTTVTRLKQEKGVQTFNNIPDAEHFVTVENDRPGLRRLDVVVNGHTFKVKKLDDYEIALIDIASAMQPGPVNTISLIPYGKKGDSALVMIADH